MARHKVFEIADYFLSKEKMSPKKLQKILYYSYSWFLVLKNETKDDLQNLLFDDKFEAWVHGPVVRKVYFHYKQEGYWMNEEIPKADQSTEISEEVRDVLEQVWEVYGNYTGDELESISHQEDPWIKAREGKTILERSNQELDDGLIFEYYGSRLAG